MNNKYLLTIIIPYFNPGLLIEHSLASVKEILTRHNDVEFIFVDDGSNEDDCSHNFINAINNEESVKIYHKNNQGLGIARNFGINKSNGEWILFLDCDDYLEPDLISLFKGIVSSNEADVIFSKYRLTNKDNIYQKSDINKDIKIINKNTINYNFVTRKIVPLLPGTFFKKSFIVDNALWQEKLKWSEDQHFIFRMLGKVDKVIYMQYVGYNYLQNVNTSIMKSTKLDVIINAYQYFVDLEKDITDPFVKKYMLARWALGNLHTIARRKDYKDYISLINAIPYRKFLKRLLSFPSLKIRLVCITGLISKKLLFILLSH